MYLPVWLHLAIVALFLLGLIFDSANGNCATYEPPVSQRIGTCVVHSYVMDLSKCSIRCTNLGTPCYGFTIETTSDPTPTCHMHDCLSVAPTTASFQYYRSACETTSVDTTISTTSADTTATETTSADTTIIPTTSADTTTETTPADTTITSTSLADTTSTTIQTTHADTTVLVISTTTADTTGTETSETTADTTSVDATTPTIFSDLTTSTSSAVTTTVSTTYHDISTDYVDTTTARVTVIDSTSSDTAITMTTDTDITDSTITTPISTELTTEEDIQRIHFMVKDASCISSLDVGVIDFSLKENIDLCNVYYHIAEDNSVGSFVILFDEYRDSTIQCSSLCARHKLCASFTFKKLTKNCQGFTL